MNAANEPARLRAYLSVAAAASLWGTWSLFLRPARVDARWVAVIVFAAMTLFGAPLLLRREARWGEAHPLGDAGRAARWWTGLVLFGLSDAANGWLFFNAMERTDVSIAVLSHYLAPSLVAVLAPYLAGTPRQRFAISRALLGTAGLVLVLAPWRAQTARGDALAGALLGGASAVFYAANVCLSKRLAAGFSSEEQLVYHSAVAFVPALLIALVSGAPLPSVRGALLATTAGAIVGVSGAVLFVRGVARVPAEHASILTFLEPVVAVGIGMVVLGERLGPTAFLGACIVLLTGVLAARAEA